MIRGPLSVRPRPVGSWAECHAAPSSASSSASVNHQDINIYLLKHFLVAGYDVVLVESVGVGQSETELSDLTDIFVLCVAPNSGDEVQSMKRGINERADLILVNKADEPLSEEARQTLMELKMSQYLRSHPAQVHTYSLDALYSSDYPPSL